MDEVGYTPINREECNLFFRFIANRYEKASTIVTSNKAFSDWTELFHEPVIVTAILDRLLHHSTVINIRGNSYRLMGKTVNEVVEEDQKIEKSGSVFTTENGSNLKRPLTTGYLLFFFLKMERHRILVFLIISDALYQLAFC